MVNVLKRLEMKQRGYKDGFAQKEKLSASMLEAFVKDYMDGYAEGKADKEKEASNG